MPEPSVQSPPEKQDAVSLNPPKRWKLPLGGLLFLLGLGWALYFIAGNALGETVVARWPGIILALGGSKVPDLAGYVTHRLFEALYLATFTLAMLVGGWVMAKALARRWRSPLSFLWISMLLFVWANVWCYGAGRVALFWLLLRGPTVENQAQFKTKELLLKEIKNVPVLGLVGSSQARAQFHEEKFNEIMGKKAWMVDLDYPGSLASDVYFVSRRWEKEQVDGFVFYLSPLVFYVGNATSIGRDLLRLRDIPEWTRCGAWTTAADGDIPRYVALGVAMPLFQARPVFQHALFGIVSPQEVAMPRFEPPAMPRRADTTRITPRSEYEKRLFIKFLESTQARHQRVILVMGQFNPLHEAEMAPDVRPDYEAFVRDCAARFPHVVLVTQDEILPQGPEAYEDSCHATEETSRLFTESFCRWLQGYEAQNGPLVTNSAAPR